MTRRRFIADDFSGDRAALVGEHAAHLARVLRAQVGQDFDIATGDVVRRGVISRVAPDRVDFDLGEAVAAVPSAAIHLVLAIYKFDRLEWAIEKCTELGVARITPAIAKRTDAHLAAAAAKRRERWQRIAQQAAEQSRRVSPPEIAAPVKLAEALPAAGLRIVLAEMERTARLRDVMEAAAGQGAIHLAIGPEGGWTEEEMKLFQTSGWVAASLGKTILRAETAAIAATALAASALASF